MSGDKFYNVDIDCYNPRCSCYVWIKSELPCKHIFAIIEHTYITWDDLPESFRNHSLFNLDEDVLDLCKEDFALPEESAEFDPEIIEELRNAMLEHINEEMQNHLQSIIKTHASVCETPRT